MEAANRPSGDNISNQKPFMSGSPSESENMDTKKVHRPTSNKITKLNKIRIWTGIGFILFAALFVLALVIVPIIIAEKESCGMFSSYAGHEICPFGGLFIWGLIGSFVIGVPAFISGLSFLLYGIFDWKNVKKPGTAVFLTIVLSFTVIATIVIGALVIRSSMAK